MDTVDALMFINDPILKHPLTKEIGFFIESKRIRNSVGQYDADRDYLIQRCCEAIAAMLILP